jgi:broad specificity phosphatase PhoE
MGYFRGKRPLKLYLLRHGESAANVERVFAARKIDPPLSLAGREQIERQSKALASIEFDACCTSPLLRATQSAEILSREIGLQFKKTNALLEINVGFLDGEPQDVSRNWAVYKDVIKRWEGGQSAAAFPGGESLRDVDARFTGLLTGLEGKKKVLLLGHCLLFMCVIWSFAENRGSTLESGHMGRGRLSLLAKTEKGFRVQCFNHAPAEIIAEQDAPADVEDTPR